MQLVIVSNGLRVISRGTTDGNAIGLFGADETVRSLCRDELMAEVGGGMEEDAGRGGDPSIGRRRHGPKSRRSARPKVFGHAAYVLLPLLWRTPKKLTVY